MNTTHGIPLQVAQPIGCPAQWNKYRLVLVGLGCLYARLLAEELSSLADNLRSNLLYWTVGPTRTMAK